MQVRFTDPSRFSQGGQFIADDRGNGHQHGSPGRWGPLLQSPIWQSLDHRVTQMRLVTGLAQEFRKSSSAPDCHQWPLDRLHYTAMLQCCIIPHSLQSQNSIKFPIFTKVEPF